MLANKTAEWSKAMRNEDVSKLLLRRFAAAQHPVGRLLLNLHVLLQRVRSQWRAHGTDIIKRTSDILVSVFFLVLLSPLFLLIALMVQIEDGGPVFFAQTRVGRFGREFKMYKIRSMCLDAEERLKELLGQNH